MHGKCMKNISLIMNGISGELWKLHCTLLKDIILAFGGRE
jgi:hypothetical protein